MIAIPELVVTPSDLAAADDFVHLVCVCNVNKALCGKDVTDRPWRPETDETTCVVCDAMEDQACPYCGAFVL